MHAYVHVHVRNWAPAPRAHTVTHACAIVRVRIEGGGSAGTDQREFARINRAPCIL